MPIEKNDLEILARELQDQIDILNEMVSRLQMALLGVYAGNVYPNEMALVNAMHGEKTH